MAPNNALAKSNLNEEQNDGGQNSKGMVSKAEIESRGDGINPPEKALKPKSWLVQEILYLLTAVMFLTRLPCPSWVDHNPRSLVPGMTYFTLIGSFVGLWVSVWYEVVSLLWSPTVASTGSIIHGKIDMIHYSTQLASTLAGIWITGCFHEDGLADTLDAFGGGWGRSQILRIMKDSRVGTYALVGTILMLVTKVSLLTQLEQNHGVEGVRSTLICAHTMSRCTSLWLVKLFPYVHDEGDDKGLLYNSFAGCLRKGLLTWPRVLLSTTYTFLLVTVLFDMKMALTFAAGLYILVLGAGNYGNHVIGGVIGDYLGAIIILTELCVYMMVTVKQEDLQRLLYNDPSVYLLPVLRLLLVFGIPAAFMKGAGPMSNTNNC